MRVITEKGRIRSLFTFQIEEKDVKLKEAEKVAAALGADEDEDESALFYNDLMPMMVSI